MMQSIADEREEGGDENEVEKEKGGDDEEWAQMRRLQEESDEVRLLSFPVFRRLRFGSARWSQSRKRSEALS